MVHGIILTDANYLGQEFYVTRGNGAHRIATYLRENGYDIEVVDYCLRWTVEEFEQLCSKLVSEKTLFLGIGSNLFFDTDSLSLLVNWFKNRYPHISIVLGGNNTIYRDIPCVDYYVDGYAENSMLILLSMLSNMQSPENIKWTMSNNKKFIHSNKDYAYHNTSDLAIKYLNSDFIRSAESLAIETARGCIFKCKFCTYPLLGKKKIDYLRDPENLKKELQQNYDLWGTTNYIMAEDTFNDSQHKLQLLEKAITSLPFKIQFVTYARLDLIMAYPDSIELLRNMGLKGIHFGIETFSPTAAKIIGKPTNIEKIKDGLLWFKNKMPEVTVNASMIVGLPEDHTDPWEHLDWFQKSPIDFYTFNPLYLLNLDKAVHHSEFSKSYADYGYERMTEQEIEYEISLDGQDQNNFNIHRQQGHRSKVMLWKNKKNGTNYMQLSRVCSDLTKASRKRKISCWDIFDRVGLGYSIEECQTWGYYDHVPHIPHDELKQRAKQIVNNYKQNKINYNYNDYYSSNKKSYKKIYINQTQDTR